MSRYQRRGIAWAVAAIVALAFWWGQPSSSPSNVAASTRVLVVVRPLAAGDRIAAADVALRMVEFSHGLAHSLRDPGRVVGRTAAVALSPGSPLMDAEVAADSEHVALLDVAIKVDPDAGVPAGTTGGIRGDLVLTQAGRPPRTVVVMSNVEIVSASHSATSAVVTLRLPPRLVTAAIAAESAGDLRLVVHTTEGSR